MIRREHFITQGYLGYSTLLSCEDEGYTIYKRMLLIKIVRFMLNLRYSNLLISHYGDVIKEVYLPHVFIVYVAIQSGINIIGSFTDQLYFPILFKLRKSIKISIIYCKFRHIFKWLHPVIVVTDNVTR
ncbi:hypothetical protein F4703DRAFT_1798083 [Phycomyces blakesleeanus]